MTGIVVPTLALLLGVVVAPYSLVRIGRWTAAAYRDWVIGAIILYSVVVTLVVSRFGRA